MSDFFLTISNPTEGFYKEKGSRFIAIATPAETLEEVEERLTDIRKKYYDARHVCYAYRLGKNGEIWRANDDGEPSHSAGDPILNEIKSREVSNVLVAVVRYFGGTKLGVGGLITAYKSATADAFDHGDIHKVYNTEPLTITFPYERTSEINQIIHHHELQTASSEYSDQCKLVFAIPESKFENIKQLFINANFLEQENE